MSVTGHVRLRACTAVLAPAVVALALLLNAGAAWASNDPALNLAVNEPASSLYGAVVPVTLTASNPVGQDYGYNLTFRELLPVGITYVAGSSTDASGSVGDPTVITNSTSGAQTLIWSNLADLSPSSSYALSFKLHVSTADYDVGGAALGTAASFTPAAQAYVNTDPRYVPQFNADGTPIGPSSTSFTGESSLQESTTTIAAIAIDKSGPAALLRGVHDHQATYHLTVTNNDVNPTDTVTVDDWLPADLEFLGCGGANADNTTNAVGTNPGSADEYPGSGPITVPTVSGCVQPTTVETIDTTPPGVDANGNPLPAGVYTHVVWTLHNLTSGQVVTLPYAAAVAIRENTLSWAAGSTGTATTTTAPPTTGAQSTNLDNNDGPETYQNEPIVNSSEVQGNYQDPADGNASIPTSDNSVLSAVAKEIIVAKRVSSPTLTQGQIPIYTLTVSTSEYRFFDDVTVSDTLPNGQCPLDATKDFEHQKSSECEPVAGEAPSSEYASVSEQVGSGGTGDGTYDITWDESTDPALAQVPVNGTVTITFPAMTLRYYQKNGEDNTSSPILSGDSITNTAGVSGTDHVRCTGGTNAEDCSGGTTISHDASTANGTTEDTIGTGAASAGQAAPEPTIEKEVAAALPADGKCSDAKYQTTLATYGPGDQVCWLLRVSFPAGTDTRVTTLNDFLPDGLEPIAGSAVATANGTVPFTEADSSTAPQLAFTLCPGASSSGACGGSAGDVAPGGLTFEVTFASTEGPPSGHLSGDVNGNLMKFASVNTAGTTVPLRSAADFQFSVPTLGIVKTIAAVNSTNEPAGTTNATVIGGDVVTYHLAVQNSGTAAASSAEVWDELPTGESCTDVVSSDAYVCIDAGGGVPDHIIFSPINVAAGASSTLSFTVDVPSGADEPSPGQGMTDTAGVTSYQSTSNTATTASYYPGGDLDPTLAASANAPAATATASVTLARATITKSASSTIHEVSTSDATIGEPIAYTVSSSLPAGTTLYGSPTITDAVPSSLAVQDGSVAATLDGHELPYDGVTLTTSANTITVHLGTTYAVHAGGDTVALTFDATVLDTAANQRTDTITNTASLAWSDSVDMLHGLSSSAQTTVVEPNLHIAKVDNASGHLVSSGQTVSFTVTASNPSSVADVSPAHDVKVVDTVPAGLTVLNIAGNPASTGDTVSTDGGGGLYNATARTITWSDIGSLAPGASTPLHYNASVDADPSSGAPFTNSATDTTSSLPAGTAGMRTSGSATHTGYTASAADTVTVKGPAIAKSATPQSATIGGEVQYQTTVTLPVNTVFHDLTILDTLPNGLAFDGYGSTSCSAGCSPQSLGSTYSASNGTTAIGWFVGELGPFSSPQTIVVDYTAHVGSTFAGGSAVVDGDSLVNSATAQTDQTRKLSSAPSSPPAATSFQNHYGPATAAVKVIEPHITLDKEVVDGTGGTPSHTATAAPGDTLTYSIKVSNTGDAPAYQVAVADTPPATLADVTPVLGASDVTQAWAQSSPTIKWAIPGEIAPGSSVTLTYTALVPEGSVTDGETITNTASVPSYAGVPAGSLNGRTYTNALPSTDVVTVSAPALTITKTPASATATAGSGDSYRIVVGNSGHGTAHDVTVADTFPSGMNYAAGSATAAADSSFSETSDTGGSGDSAVVGWSLGNIPAGASVTITVPVSFPAATADPTTLINTAVARAPDAPASATAHGQITVHASADLEAIKSVATIPIPAGGQDTYTLSVKNLGPSDAQSVTLTDPLPASETFVSADSGCTNSSGTVTCRAATVAAGTTSSFHVTVAIDPTVTGPISNTLTVSSPTPDPNASNNTATISPASISQADVSITKTADKIQYNGGDTITYTITAHNAGPAAAENVVATDPLPSSVMFSSVSSGCTQANGTVTCDVGTLAVGASQSYTVKAIAKGTPPPAATPGTGDELIDVNKVELQVTLAAGETSTPQLTCGSGYISDGDAKVIEVDEGTGTLASVEILKSWLINPSTYEFKLDNTATGNAQVQLFGVCLPSATTADQNGNPHPLSVGSLVTSTRTLSQGDHTIAVDVGDAGVPISPSFEFLSGEGTVQGSEGDSDSSVWTYTIDVTTPTATVDVGSAPLQVQPGAAGGFTNDLEFTSVSQQVTVAAGQTTTESVICPNGYEGIEATYSLPDGLVLLGDDPEPITRVFLLDNTTGAPLIGTLDLLCLADRTGPEVDYLGPVINTASSSESNLDPDTGNNDGTAAIRIDRTVGSAVVVPAPIPPAPVTPAPIAPPSSGGFGGSPGSGPSPTASKHLVSAVPRVIRGSLRLGARSASIVVRCGRSGPCDGVAQLLAPKGRRGHRVVATASYKLAAGKKRRLVLRFARRSGRLSKAQRKKLSLSLKPKGGRSHITAVRVSSGGSSA